MWLVRLKVDSPRAKSLASSLASEEDVELHGHSLTFTLTEPRAKDARAMWNTRLRSLIVSNKIIDVIES